MPHTLRTILDIPRPRSEVFPFFADAANLEAITPPWLNFHILTPQPIEMRAGAIIDYALRLRGVPVRWRTEITAWEPPYRFVDQQIRGPYRLWRHEHLFEPIGVDSTRMTDVVTYELPRAPIVGAMLHRLMVRPDLDRIFAYRARAVLSALSPAPSGAAGPLQA